MKALDKAAQDRGSAPIANTAATSGQSDRELMLEAIEPKRGTNTPAQPTPGSNRTSSSGPADTARTSAQAQAATVLAGGWQPRRPSALAWLRVNPVYAFGGIAVLFLSAYAAYVYVQIAHPAWLLNVPRSTQTVAVAPPPAPAPVAAPSPSPGATEPVATEQPAASPANSAGSQVVPLTAVFGQSSNDAPPKAPMEKRAAESSSVLPSPSTAPRPSAPAAAAIDFQPATLPPAMQNKIAVSRIDSAAPRINPAVSEAYTALQAGQFDAAQRLYNQALRNEPANVDAMLGLAAIAQRENRNDDAHRLYMAILDVEPRNALAQSGLIALMGHADPQSSETRLKQLIAREPSAPLYFNLGNLYAEQGLWAQAQQAYFQAHHLEPHNPDYAYNLAVGLEHVGQPKLALEFYRKALQFAPATGTANFDPARIQQRISQLAARVN